MLLILNEAEIRIAIVEYLDKRRAQFNFDVEPKDLTFKMSQRHDDAPEFEGVSIDLKAK